MFYNIIRPDKHKMIITNKSTLFQVQIYCKTLKTIYIYMLHNISYTYLLEYTTVTDMTTALLDFNDFKVAPISLRVKYFSTLALRTIQNFL